MSKIFTLLDLKRIKRMAHSGMKLRNVSPLKGGKKGVMIEMLTLDILHGEKLIASWYMFK